MGLARYLSKFAALVGSDGKVPAAGIADGAVTNAKLGTDIDASKLTAGTLPIARVADGAVTAAKVAQGVAVANLGFTPLSSAIIETVSLSGGYNNGTWYQLFSGYNKYSGYYVIDFYASTQNAGGGMYSISGVTAPFYLYGGATNSADIQNLTLHQGGHALGGNSFALRTRTQYGSLNMLVEMSYNGSTLSGMNSTGGKEGFFYLRKLY